jgi:hypothetical protein
MYTIRNLATLMSEPHIYTKSRMRNVALGILLLFAIAFIVFAVFSKRSDAWLTCLLILLVLGGLGVGLTLSLRNIGLITGREGIIYLGQGYAMYTPWENIDSITSFPRVGKMLRLQTISEQADFAQAIREQRATITIHGQTLLPKKSYSPYDGYHTIPIQNFSTPQDSSSMLAQDIKRMPLKSTPNCDYINVSSVTLLPTATAN